MRRPRRIHATATLAAIVSVVPTAMMFVSPAAAAPSRDHIASASFDRGVASAAEQTVAATYRKVYPDLSTRAAKAAATAQLRSEKLKAALAARQDTYGGGWFDPYTASYHVAVTSPATADELVMIGRGLELTVKTHLVGRTLAQLQQEAEALRTGGSDLATAATGHVGFDVKTNQVVVTVPASWAAGRRLAAPAGVRVETGDPVATQDDVCSSRADCDDSLRSGLVIRRAGTAMCSLGFTARDSDNNRFALTAAHCMGVTGEVWSTGTTNQRTIGTMVDAIDDGAADAAAIQVTNSFFSGVDAGVIATGPSTSAPITGTSSLVENDVVCISARFQAPATSGNPCGTVTNLSDPDRRGQVRIDGYDACPGDSGGGWYWLAGNDNRYAAGLHSGSLEGCNVDDGISWASPLSSFWTGLTYETS